MGLPNRVDQVYHSKLTYQRLLPRLEKQFSAFIEHNPDAWYACRRRLETNFPKLFSIFHRLYGDRYDFFYHLEQLLVTTLQCWSERPADLKELDACRASDPLWFQSNEMIGGVCYVDLFAGDLRSLREKIPYFKTLGLTYLHLMPLFRSPDGDNDGGYAVSSYREVDHAIGTMDELVSLAAELRKNSISLVLDFVFNHTSDEHEWARRARAGEPDYQAYYYLFPDQNLPDAYETHLREIFPDEHPGAFTFHPQINKWVWTTFHDYQWDLNYHNPAVFTAMAEEMLRLANVGMEILRLDAVAFIWKRMGTSCENLPEAHLIIQAFNALARIAAPAMLLKSEAIVHPDEVVRYIDPGECQLSYNPLLMALLWNSLATREVRLLRLSMTERFRINPACSWVNYIRSHDDIGWTFSDEDAARLGINSYDHRRFLNAFYNGRFEGSFAFGLPFQINPRTGDARVCGTCASLAGLEKALHEETALEVDLAVRRILLIHSIIMSIGGIPLIYFGDELGMLNDYSYQDDPEKHEDNRWVHRQAMDWQKAGQRTDPNTVEGRIFQGLCHLITLRKAHNAFAGGDMEVVDTDSDHIFGYTRSCGEDQIMILANFTENRQKAASYLLQIHSVGNHLTDLISGKQILVDDDLVLEPYAVVWLGMVE